MNENAFHVSINRFVITLPLNSLAFGTPQPHSLVRNWGAFEPKIVFRLPNFQFAEFVEISIWSFQFGSSNLKKKLNIYTGPRREAFHLAPNLLHRHIRAVSLAEHLNRPK